MEHTTVNRTDSEDICDNTTRYEEESINTNTKKRRERKILGEQTTSIERFRMIIYQMQTSTDTTRFRKIVNQEYLSNSIYKKTSKRKREMDG